MKSEVSRRCLRGSWREIGEIDAEIKRGEYVTLEDAERTYGAK